ncbi:hypothetical protein [Stigmatella aurantiaca]|uniref:Uncharacterized protein n=1 Tax=Stigmatella aurantiaca (strain DW4/3-1) TaxID=378806 RepID=Q091W1_STIAD|nr:hypothetical protein [Stigmatella aurantiaca]ADO71666.1 uncharacterized protein STAUR_3878 [Stigmatella aurantiaca DW4/3-1]EAU66531.1 hypothetical protein STIAU_2517 [Stigmatella aurantiaca DW4/3-1]
MSKYESKPQVAPEAIRVETAATVQGPAATTISVEVEESKLGQSGADANRAERAIAMVPSTHDGKQEWREEELRHSGGRVTHDERVLKTFNATVPGPVDAHDSGVSVKVETPSGTVWANDKSKPLATRDADKALPGKPKV